MVCSPGVATHGGVSKLLPRSSLPCVLPQPHAGRTREIIGARSNYS